MIVKWIKSKKLLLAEAALVTVSGFAVNFTVLSIVAVLSDSVVITAATVTTFSACKNLCWRIIFRELRKKGEKETKKCLTLMKKQENA